MYRKQRTMDKKNYSLLPTPYSLIFALCSLLIVSCSNSSIQNNENGFSSITVYKDVPGVTQQEIDAIEALRETVKERGRPLIVGSTHNTESFIAIDGTIGGFIPLLSKWLTDLFDIPFVTEVCDLNDMLSGMFTGELDFGINAYTPERLQEYYLAEPIISRSLKIMRTHTSLPLHEIERRRLVRYAFLQNATQYNIVSGLLPPDSFEPVFAENYDALYHVLARGDADAMIVYNTSEASFDIYGGVIVEDFLPFSAIPLSLSAGLSEFEPVLTIVTKALNHGAHTELTELYRKGYQEYLKNKFLMQLTEEEKAYMRENPVIPYVAMYMSYPDSFYDENDGTWKGMVFDILNELEQLTEFTFELINENNTNLPVLLSMLESGEAYLIPHLTHSEARRERFILSDIVYLQDRFSLLSKSNYPNVELNDIPFERVGFAAGSVFAEVFRRWFPNALYASEYPSIADAFNAIERGEIDLVLTSHNRLLALTNYYEFSDYKANYNFDTTLDSSFAFNNDQPVLASIIDKALPLVNTDRIVDYWESITYNLEVMRLREQRRWLVFTFILSSLAFITVMLILLNNNKKRKTIASLLEKTKSISDYELMKHALTIKAMNVALWDVENTDAIAKGKNPFDYNSNFRYSKEFRQMLGYTDETDFPNILSSWVNNIHPDDKERAMNDVVSHLKDFSGKTSYESEYRIKTKNGEYRYVRSIGDTLRDNTGAPVRMAGAIEDITEKKQLAEALERNQEIYINSLENILNSIDALIYVSVPETGELLFVNKNIKKAFGMENDSMIGKKCYKMFRKLDEPCNYCPCPRLNEDPEQIIVWEEYNEFLNKYLLYSDCYIDWPNGSKVHLHYAVDITDLTERKIAEEKAKASSEAKSIFLATMSHEIRTPMNSIIGFSELARNSDNPPKTSEYLNKISESAEMLLDIINDILDISKIESGRIELECIPFDLHEIFAYCRTVILPKAEEKGLELYCYAEPSIGKKMIGDPVRLRQVLINILSNAVKFTNAGTIKLLASITKIDKNSVTVNFEVKDSGIGMSPEHRKKIFEPFIQADNSITRKFGGTGLGLTIAKSIVEMMGGELKVESVPGVGSKFFFELTFDVIEDTAAIQHRKTEPNEMEKPYFEGEVLVCEDNGMNQEVICEHLSRVGLKTVIAENGREGIDIVNRRIENGKPFDLIFMDIHMPVMDGIEAAKQLIDTGCKTPIIALTANIMASDREAYLAMGMRDCLPKPFTTNDLWLCLLKYLTPVKFVSFNNVPAEEEKKYKMYVSAFLKNNRDVFNEINSAIEAKDLKLAHRLAHTLKSTAGFIGRKTLQQAAKNLEASLAAGIDAPKEEMDALEKELSNALKELGSLAAIKAAESDVKTNNYNRKEIMAFLKKLDVLLEQNNVDCIDLIDQLSSIPGTGELINQVINLDFAIARETLADIMSGLINIPETEGESKYGEGTPAGAS